METLAGCFLTKDDDGRESGLDWQAAGERAEVEGAGERGFLEGMMGTMTTLEVEHQQPAKRNLAFALRCEMGLGFILLCTNVVQLHH